jgi:signal transduction histidine kinase/ligand-binding sensor domain-containing protein
VRILAATCAGVLALVLSAPVAAGASAPRVGGAGQEGAPLPDVVTAICQDHSGLLWIGSRDGLLLFDGQSVRVFQHDIADPESISDNAIRTIYEDRRGNLWVGTNSGGLDRLDRSGWRFERFRHNPGDPRTLSSDSVYAILEDADGALWVGTQQGLNRRDPGTGSFQRFLADPATPGALAADYVLTLHLDRKGVMWVGTLGGGLYRREPGRDTFTAFRHDPKDQRTLGDDRVTAILDDPDGFLWVGTVQGINRMDPGDGSFRRFSSGAPGRRAPASGGDAGPLIKALAAGRAGALWVGTHADGLLELDLKTGALREWAGVGGRLALGSPQIEALLVDGSGTLWIGTWGGGLRRLSPTALLLSADPRLAPLPEDLSGASVTGITVGARGEVWFGSEKGDLVRFDPLTGSRHDFRAPPADGPVSVFGMVEDTSGEVWYGTSRGVVRMEIDTGRTRVLRHDPNDPASIGPGYVRVVMKDREGRIWIGTGEGGVQRLDAEGRVTARFVQDPANPRSLSDNYITAMHQDQEGILWIGTRSGGLDALDPVAGTIDRFLPDLSDRESLSHHSVTFLHEDRRGRLWIATAGGGLDLAERRPGERPRFRRFTEEDGLVDDDVMGIVEDDDGSLWLSTRRGLARFEPESGTFIGIHASDGLPTEEFEAAIAARGARTLYFSTIKGVITIPAGTPFPQLTPSPAILTSVRTPEGEVHGAGPGWAPDRLTIPYGEWLSIEMAVLDYSPEHKHRYSYRLEKSWVDLGPGRAITFTGLRPGTFAFAARGRNAAGIWSPPTPDLRIEVVPPFWLTGWFRVAAALTVVSLAFLGHRVRLSAVERRNRALEELHRQRERARQELSAANERLRLLARRLEAAKEDERQRIARELHDELGPSLTAVIINLQLLARDGPAPAGAARIRDGIEIADRLVQRVRDLSLDLRPPLLDELGLPAALRGYLETQAERTGLRIPVVIGPGVEGMPREVEIHAFRVVQEAVTNAIRHAAPSQVSVGVERRGGDLLLEVGDDGRGFDVERTMASISGKALGLLGMHERVRSLGGDIRIESGPGRGTAVRARIPLGGGA